MKNYLSENKALIITILGTIILLVLMGVILSISSKKQVSQTGSLNISEDKKDLLIKGDSHVFGNSQATIEVVEFSDFQCPACGYYFSEFEKFKTKYENDVKFVFRHFPLNKIHKRAFLAAEASESANAQGKFWEFHNKLFENQSEWSALSKNEAIDKFVEYAKAVGVNDIEKFRSDLENETFKDRVQEDLNDATSLGLPGTPTVFVNGEKVENPTFENLEKASGLK